MPCQPCSRMLDILNNTSSSVPFIVSQSCWPGHYHPDWPAIYLAIELVNLIQVKLISLCLNACAQCALTRLVAHGNIGAKLGLTTELTAKCFAWRQHHCGCKCSCIYAAFICNLANPSAFKLNSVLTVSIETRLQNTAHTVCHDMKPKSFPCPVLVFMSMLL